MGALFDAGVAGRHTCTASVVHSTGGDLLLTAAHCVAGAGVGLKFVPGYAGGAAPQGVWSVTAAFVDAAYAASRDEADDVAVLRVARQPIGGTRPPSSS